MRDKKQGKREGRGGGERYLKHDRQSRDEVMGKQRSRESKQESGKGTQGEEKKQEEDIMRVRGREKRCMEKR